MTTTFSNFFTVNTDTDGKRYTALTDDCPDWLRAAVVAAHRGSPPSDWVHVECRDAAIAFDEEVISDPTDDDAIYEYIDDRVTASARELYQWAADLCTTELFAAAEQDAAELEDPEAPRVRRGPPGLKSVQYSAIKHVVDTVCLACLAATKSQP
jgi:hypothetical protein